MRFALAVLLALLAQPSAASDSLDQSLDHLIRTGSLAPRRAEAHAKCTEAVPRAAEFLNRPLIDKFCVVRLGAPRTNALFLGEQLSQWFDSHGDPGAAKVVDELLVDLERVK